MGLFSDLFSQNNSADEHIPAIMPPGALDQIRQGIIPTMRTDRIMLTQGEVCHFSERAILMTEKTQKRYDTVVVVTDTFVKEFTALESLVGALPNKKAVQLFYIQGGKNVWCMKQ